MSVTALLALLLAAGAPARRVWQGAPPAHLAADTVAAATPAFDASRLDVAGLRLGVGADEFTTAVSRLFGPATRVRRDASWFPGYTAALEVNAMHCMTIPGRRRGGEAGNVCVMAWLDADDIVRGIRIERVFAFLDEATFRATLVRRYGAVAVQRNTGSYALGWGPLVARSLSYDSTGPGTALTAHYTVEDDMLSQSLNRLPRIRVTLQLVDAAWARTAQ